MTFEIYPPLIDVGELISARNLVEMGPDEMRELLVMLSTGTGYGELLNIPSEESNRAHSNDDRL